MSEIPFYAGGRRIFCMQFFVRAPCAIHPYSAHAEIVESLLLTAARGLV